MEDIQERAYIFSAVYRPQNATLAFTSLKPKPLNVSRHPPSLAAPGPPLLPSNHHNVPKRLPNLPILRRPALLHLHDLPRRSRLSALLAFKLGHRLQRRRRRVRRREGVEGEFAAAGAAFDDGGGAVCGQVFWEEVRLLG